MDLFLRKIDATTWFLETTCGDPLTKVGTINFLGCLPRAKYHAVSSVFENDRITFCDPDWKEKVIDADHHYATLEEAVKAICSAFRKQQAHRRK